MDATTDVRRYAPTQVEADNITFFKSALAAEMQSARFEHFVLASMSGDMSPYRFCHFNYRAAITCDASDLRVGNGFVTNFRTAMAKIAEQIEAHVSGPLKSRVMKTEGDFEIEFNVAQYWGGPDSDTLFQDPTSLRADDRLGRLIKVKLSSLAH